MRFIFLFFLLPLTGFGQQSISGTVVEKESGAAIPYATIGLLKQNSGTNADETGKFMLRTASMDDSVIVSCIGYETVKVPVEYLSNHTEIRLIAVNRALRPIIIKTRWTYESLHPVQKCGHYSLTSNGYQHQVAQRMEAPAANAWLQDVKICLGKNKGETVFRLRVYDMDSVTKGPGTELTDTVVQVRARKSPVFVDMQPYRIVLSGRTFFVAVEWLAIASNEDRFTTNFEGRKTEMVHYKPFLSFGEPSKSHLDVWMLNYRNQWSPMHPEGHSLDIAVSATVKY